MFTDLDFIQDVSGHAVDLAQLPSQLGGAIVENFSSTQFLWHWCQDC